MSHRKPVLRHARFASVSRPLIPYSRSCSMIVATCFAVGREWRVGVEGRERRVEVEGREGRVGVVGRNRRGMREGVEEGVGGEASSKSCHAQQW